MAIGISARIRIENPLFPKQPLSQLNCTGIVRITEVKPVPTIYCTAKVNRCMDTSKGVLAVDEVVLGIDRLARELVGLTARALAEEGSPLTFVQYRTLVVVSETPGISQKALAQSLGVDRSTMSRTLGRLRKRDLVVVSIAEGDARRAAIRLTPAADSLIERVFRRRRYLIASRVRTLSVNRQRAVTVMVSDLVDLLRRQDGMIDGFS
ncbi:MAG: MarR family winged helix-turn-helix transcriptional regulator [Ferrimicrobium sp.]